MFDYMNNMQYKLYFIIYLNEKSKLYILRHEHKIP